MDLTGIAFDTATLQAGALLVLGFVVAVASIKAVISMIRYAGSR
ncbi:MAG: hypothetical protein ACYCYR_17025 [Desulfobulbaceae bacterium]